MQAQPHPQGQAANPPRAAAGPLSSSSRAAAASPAELPPQQLRCAGGQAGVCAQAVSSQLHCTSGC